MKFKPHSVLQGMAGTMMCLAFVAGAQTPAAPAPASHTAADTTAASTPAALTATGRTAPVWSLGTIDFSGYVDGYFSYNFNRPGQDSTFGQVNQLYNFDDQTNFGTSRQRR